MKRTGLFAWALMAPALLSLGIFVIYPGIKALILSFYEVDPFSAEEFWVGFQNYADLFTSESFLQSIRVSFLFMLFTAVPSVIFSLLLALLLDASPYFQSFFRTIFLLPVSISSAMAAMLWIFLYNPTAGYLNYFLEFFHINGPNWLGDPSSALIAVSIATVWKELGFGIVFFLAGLSTVPSDLREAAQIDGAGVFQTFWHVTLPVLSPTVLFVTVVNVIHAFESFGQIHLLTAGGPAGETTTLIYGLYRDAFVNFQTGSASAQAVVLFLIICGATVIQFTAAKRKLHYG